jgi:hypothetical protein
MECHALIATEYQSTKMLPDEGLRDEPLALPTA